MGKPIQINPIHTVGYANRHCLSHLRFFIAVECQSLKPEECEDLYLPQNVPRVSGSFVRGSKDLGKIIGFGRDMGPAVHLEGGIREATKNL
jgi:hypothetical protein